MSILLRWYLQALKKHPWKIQIGSTGIIMASGDLMCQVAVEDKHLKTVDVKRVLRFSLIGFCFVGPVLRTWYLALERICGITGSAVGLKKMLLDQVLFVPVFISGFLVVTGAMQRQTWVDIKLKFHNDYFAILKANYMLWPAVQLVTFYLIPFNHRILFVNIVALFWNSYLAWKTNKVDSKE